MQLLTRRTALTTLLTAGGAGATASLLDRSPATAGSGRQRRPVSGAQLVRMVEGARSGDRITLDEAVQYVLPRAMRLTAASVLLDGVGATVRLAPGAELGGDRLLTISGSDDVVRGVRFAPRTSGERRQEESRSIDVHGLRNTVTGCTVTTKAATAIGIGGGSDHVISANRVSGGGGILYAWADAQRTRCTKNVVLHAQGNAMGGVGNATRAAAGHVVSDNVIEDCARFGIEDFGNIVGTRIDGNSLKDVALMGISAVGGAPVVTNNRLVDAGVQNGIETGASGTRISGNTIRWLPGNVGRGAATGIIVNNAWNRSAATRFRGYTGSGNTITGAGIGLDLYGDLTDVLSKGDHFVNCRIRGINAAPKSARRVLIDGADIEFDLPSATGVALRDGITVAEIDTVTVLNGTVTFAARSAGGPAEDFFIRIDRDHVTVQGCTFDAGGRTDSGRPTIGNDSAEVIRSATVTGNRFLNGARLQSGKLVADSVIAPNTTG